jgi:hypothetical protein
MSLSDPVNAYEEDISLQPALSGEYSPPQPDPARVQAHLDDLRGETAYLAVVEHLRLFAASYEALAPIIPAARNWLYRRSRDMGYGAELSDAGMWTLLYEDAQNAVQRAASVRAHLVRQASLIEPREG